MEERAASLIAMSKREAAHPSRHTASKAACRGGFSAAQVSRKPLQPGPHLMGMWHARLQLPLLRSPLSTGSLGVYRTTLMAGVSDIRQADRKYLTHDQMVLKDSCEKEMATVL